MPKILIVDDDPTLLKAYERALRDQGFDVVVAWNPCDVLGVLREDRVDLVISDIDMPQMAGDVLCRRIRAEGGWMESLPVILISGHPEGERKATECGANAFLPKPCKLAHILKYIAFCGIHPPG